MLKEFKAFITRGNLVDLAVAFVLGVAFSAVVSSIVADTIMPIVAAIFGQPDFSKLKINIGQSAIFYGKFLTALVTFLIVALVMFMIVKAYNRLKGPQATTTKDCPFCLSSVPLAASRCPECTSPLEGAVPPPPPS